MIGDRHITFNRFYVLEFLQAIRGKISEVLAPGHAELMTQFIDNLKSEDDIEYGIEKLAREQGTGELSIFLFDIVDRIEDYPPTVAFDALPDIAEDFVNVLSVMLEDESTVEALNIVNADLAGEAIAPERQETVETEAVTEPEPVHDPGEFEVSTVKSAGVQEMISFESFVYREVDSLFVKFLGEFDSPVGTEKLQRFSELVLAIGELPPEAEIPKILLKLMQVRQMLFPWDYELDYKPSKIMSNLSQNARKFIDLIVTLSNENQLFILNSLENDQIILTKPAFMREEVPPEPTTIDGLLSEYFRSEVEEHTEQIKKTLEELEEQPADKARLKDLLGYFQSLNEISMIHGYSPIESFCSHMTDILSNGIKENQVLSQEAAQLFDRMFGLLKNIEPLKDARAETKEAADLLNLGENMAGMLLTMRAKKVPKPPAQEAKSEEKSVSEVLSEPERRQRTEQIPAASEISIHEQDKIFPILKDILIRSSAVMEKTIHNETQQQKLIILLDTFTKDAELLTLSEIATALTEFRQFVQLIHTGAVRDKQDAIKFMLSQYESFVNEITPEFVASPVRDSLQTYSPPPEMIGIGDTPKLLQILGVIEEKNQKKFSEILALIAEGDEDQCAKQIRHFRRLIENLNMIGSTRHVVFPQFYINVFEDRSQIANLGKPIMAEFTHSYKLFVDSLTAGGSGVDPGELVAVLEELTSKPDEVQTPAEDERLEPHEKKPESIGVEEGEEDLEEIFRQESENSFNQIKASLEKLASQLNDADQYGAIERNLHSLKSSARLMGYTDIADIAAPLEDICENIHSGFYAPTEEALDIIREGITLLETKVQGGKIDSESFRDKLEKLSLPEISQDEKKSAPDMADDEKPLFSTSEEDDTDLLEIFKDESDQYISILEAANQNLMQNPGDSRSLRDLETASHSLKSAAKMLGFREIGQVGDILEIAAEAMQKGKVRNTKISQQHIAQAIQFIKTLTSGEKDESVQLGEIITSLQIDKLKSYAEEEMPPEEGEENDLGTFQHEVSDLLEKINNDLLKIEKRPEDPALLNNLYRNMHTLKGSAQIMRFDMIGNMAHGIEDFFEAARQGKKAISSDTLDLIFKAVDEIQSLTDSIMRNGTESSDHYSEILNAIDTIPEIADKPAKEPLIRRMDEKGTDQLDIDQEHTIKLTTQRLDHLMNMAAGLIVNKTQLNNYLESMKAIVNRIDKDRNRLRSTRKTIDMLVELNENRDPKSEVELPLNDLNQAAQDFSEVLMTLDGVSSDFYSITQHLEQNIREISQLTKQLHDDILQARMVPSEFLFNRFPRAVRDLARKQKKKINLMVEGETTELDRAMIEALTDPVMHLIRNAIDHGIELPKERKDKGKSEDGIVLLKALRDKNQIIIEVHDDGRGMDPAIIAEKAVKLGLAQKSQVKKMHDEEILDLIFMPGFSTIDKATDVSGRGVGLDVVATQIQKMNGDISLNSTPDKGTIFRIRIPLTLAITQAMLVEIDGEIIAVPISAIDEAIEVNMQDIVTENDLTFLNFRNQKLPVKNMASFLNYEEQERKPDKPSGLIIHEGELKYVLQVDAVLRREEIVVKSLGPELKEVPYISGGTVLGDGSVVLILDMAAITHKIEIEYAGEGKDFSSLETARQVLSDKDQKKSAKKRSNSSKKKKTAKTKTITQKKITGRKPMALIVDDSQSVRKFVSAVLERNNYTTILANDGPEALDKVHGTDFDIIITDLEMPKMHGFDLIENIRSKNEYNDIPIVILTGKSGREHEEKGKKAGANAYIIKPFKENDLVKTLEKFIITV